MTSDDLQTILNVAEDLRFLRAEWDQEVDDHSLRRSSVVLRRLLVDGELLRAWRVAGYIKQPIVTAVSLEAALHGVAYSTVRWAQAGGARYRDITVMSPAEFSFAMSASDVKRRYQQFKHAPPLRDLSLRRFIESGCAIVDGAFISRQILIEYVANNLGGAHPIDPKRDAAKQKDPLYTLLDKARTQRIVADKCAIYFELLSIGQALSASADIQHFVSTFRSSGP